MICQFNTFGKFYNSTNTILVTMLVLTKPKLMNKQYTTIPMTGGGTDIQLGAGVRGCKAADYPCEGQELGG